MATDDVTTERFPRRAARRQQTRSRILEAALIQFKRVGYADATMNAIADAADVHVTTLFTHFKAKRDLATSLADAEIERLEELIAAAKGKVPFFDFFRDLVRTTATTRQEEGDPKMGIGQELQQDPELALSWLKYEQQEVALLAEYIAHDYGIDRHDYVQFLVANTLIYSGVASHTRWRGRKNRTDLVAETIRALDLAEQAARAILPPAPEAPAAPR